MKKLLSLIIAACLIAGITGTLSACNSGYTSERYVSLSINPLIEFVVDTDNKIQAVNAANADAEMLIAETDFIGMKLEDATAKFVELATAAGYIDVVSQDNEVTVSVIGESGEEKSEKSLEDTIYKYFENNGIYGKVSREALDQYAAKAAGLNVSTGKMKMIIRARDMGVDYTEEELAEMPVKELVRLFKNKAKDNLGATLRAEYKAAKAVIRANYTEMFVLDDEIAALETQIAEFAGSTEDKETLEQELLEKKNAYNTLRAAYDAQIKSLNDEYKIKREDLQSQRKTALEEKINDHKSKIAEHKAQFEKNRKEIKEKIRKWRKANAA